MGMCFWSASPVVGSSPRAWGNALAPDAMSIYSRVIPTCVGKWGRSNRSATILAGHPHVRGEMGGESDRRAALYGSSPRAWGNDEAGSRDDSSQRVIPTCVGKCRRQPCTGCCNTGHPHVRGEMQAPQELIVDPDGSSPRAWGHVAIPSGARWRSSGHPHVRGEMCKPVREVAPDRGSSPRAWGNAWPV